MTSAVMGVSKAARKVASNGALAVAASDEKQASIVVLGFCVVSLILIGFVAMSSASIEFAAYKYGNPFFHVTRYGFHMAVALVGALVVYRVPMGVWERCSPLLLFAAFILLMMVLIPGVGRKSVV